MNLSQVCVRVGKNTNENKRGKLTCHREEGLSVEDMCVMYRREDLGKDRPIARPGPRIFILSLSIKPS